MLKIQLNESVESSNGRLVKLLQLMKRRGARQQYDCIVGVSGGVDSAWTLHLAVEMGLRPLAVHMDNGFDTPKAQKNIHSLVSALRVDYVSWVIDWDEYRSLLRSFLRANVVDLELLYDNALYGACYSFARRFDVRFILGGTNTRTEGMRMPLGWNWSKWDARNIRAIHRHYESTPVHTFPFFSTFSYLKYKYLFGIRWISFLDYFKYDKDAALDRLTAKYGFLNYGEKHSESVMTRFYQRHLLPTKFGIDKRRLHLANLVATEHMTRKEALELINQPAYKTNVDLQMDTDYFLKKIGEESNFLEQYISAARVEHDVFATETHFTRRMRKVWHVIRTFYVGFVGRSLELEADAK